MLSHRRLSELIGMIYDCAIEADRWSAILAEICQSIDSMSGFLLLVDLEQSNHKFAHSWGLSADWKERYFAYSDQLTGFYGLAFGRQYHPDGEPLIMSRRIDLTGPNGKRVYKHLRRTLGITDVMQTVVLREARCIAILTANRHQDGHTLMDEDAATIRLLVPHVRRAVKIIDILNVKKIEADTLAATLDTFLAGIMIVGEEGRILHANDSAKRMLSAHNPIISCPCLAACARRCTEAFDAAGNRCRFHHARRAQRVDRHHRTCTKLRSDPSRGPAPPTTRLERHACPGSENTRHIARNGAHTPRKTCVSRQADLLSLIDRFAPPIRRTAR
jgi:PAS domain-containing protein